MIRRRFLLRKLVQTHMFALSISVLLFSASIVAEWDLTTEELKSSMGSINTWREGSSIAFNNLKSPKDPLVKLAKQCANMLAEVHKNDKGYVLKFGFGVFLETWGNSRKCHAISYKIHKYDRGNIPTKPCKPASEFRSLIDKICDKKETPRQGQKSSNLSLTKFPMAVGEDEIVTIQENCSYMDTTLITHPDTVELAVGGVHEFEKIDVTVIMYKQMLQTDIKVEAVLHCINDLRRKWFSTPLLRNGSNELASTIARYISFQPQLKISAEAKNKVGRAQNFLAQNSNYVSFIEILNFTSPQEAVSAAIKHYETLGSMKAFQIASTLTSMEDKKSYDLTSMDFHLLVGRDKLTVGIARNAATLILVFAFGDILAQGNFKYSTLQFLEAVNSRRAHIGSILGFNTTEEIRSIMNTASAGLHSQIGSKLAAGFGIISEKNTTDSVNDVSRRYFSFTYFQIEKHYKSAPEGYTGYFDPPSEAMKSLLRSLESVQESNITAFEMKNFRIVKDALTITHLTNDVSCVNVAQFLEASASKMSITVNEHNDSQNKTVYLAMIVCETLLTVFETLPLAVMQVVSIKVSATQLDEDLTLVHVQLGGVLFRAKETLDGYYITLLRGSNHLNWISEFKQALSNGTKLSSSDTLRQAASHLTNNVLKLSPIVTHGFGLTDLHGFSIFSIPLENDRVCPNPKDIVTSFIAEARIEEELNFIPSDQTKADNFKQVFVRLNQVDIMQMSQTGDVDIGIYVYSDKANKRILLVLAYAKIPVEMITSLLIGYFKRTKVTPQVPFTTYITMEDKLENTIPELDAFCPRVTNMSSDEDKMGLLFNFKTVVAFKRERLEQSSDAKVLQRSLLFLEAIESNSEAQLDKKCLLPSVVGAARNSVLIQSADSKIHRKILLAHNLKGVKIVHFLKDQPAVAFLLFYSPLPYSRVMKKTLSVKDLFKTPPANRDTLNTIANSMLYSMPKIVPEGGQIVIVGNYVALISKFAAKTNTTPTKKEILEAHKGIKKKETKPISFDLSGWQENLWSHTHVAKEKDIGFERMQPIPATEENQVFAYEALDEQTFFGVIVYEPQNPYLEAFQSIKTMTNSGAMYSTFLEIYARELAYKLQLSNLGFEYGDGDIMDDDTKTPLSVLLFVEKKLKITVLKNTENIVNDIVVKQVLPKLQKKTLEKDSDLFVKVEMHGAYSLKLRKNVIGKGRLGELQSCEELAFGGVQLKKGNYLVIAAYKKNIQKS